MKWYNEYNVIQHKIKIIDEVKVKLNKTRQTMYEIEGEKNRQSYKNNNIELGVKVDRY